MIVIACPDQGTGNDPEALGLAFLHQGPTFKMRLGKDKMFEYMNYLVHHGP